MKDIIIGALPLLGVVAGALLQFLLTRSKDREDQRDLRRQEAYADYLKGVAGIAFSRDGGQTSHKAQIADSKARIVIYGSSTVIRMLADFERAGPILDNDTSVSAFLNAIQEMRKDNGRKDVGLEMDNIRELLVGSEREPRPSA